MNSDRALLLEHYSTSQNQWTGISVIDEDHLQVINYGGLFVCFFAQKPGLRCAHTL